MTTTFFCSIKNVFLHSLLFLYHLSTFVLSLQLPAQAFYMPTDTTKKKKAK